jgi:glycosyltransferase involved in cell wall biosynthesis
MITTYYPPYNFGGDGIFVQRLSNELARRGHHVEVVHCKDAYRLRRRRAAPAAYENHPGVTVHGLESSFGPLSPLATQQTGAPLFKRAALRRVLDTGFDVIHYHNISLVGGPRILMYGEGIKLYTTHEYWLVCPTHVLFRYNRAPCERPHCFLCSLTYKRPPQWWRWGDLLPRALEHLDALITPSRFSQEVHRRLEVRTPIVHLPLFISPSDSTGDGARPSSAPVGEPPFFLFVGRLEKIKGLQTLIPVFRRYDRARLVIAGTGSYEPRLRELARDCPHVEFLGHQSRPQLEALCRAAVALVVPSITFEVFPLVMVEALAQGTPLVARNLGSLPEIVDDSGAGFTYDDDESLVAALDRLVGDPALRRELGRRGREAFLRNWTAEAHIGRYLDLIDRIATSKARGLQAASR